MCSWHDFSFITFKFAAPIKSNKIVQKDLCQNDFLRYVFEFPQKHDLLYTFLLHFCWNWNSRNDKIEIESCLQLLTEFIFLAHISPTQTKQTVL